MSPAQCLRGRCPMRSFRSIMCKRTSNARAFTAGWCTRQATRHSRASTGRKPPCSRRRSWQAGCTCCRAKRSSASSAISRSRWKRRQGRGSTKRGVCWVRRSRTTKNKLLRPRRTKPMQLQAIDWIVVAVYGLASLLIGIVFTKRAGRSLEQYFLAGRKLPWWLLGTSMVATTFSTDTPNLVTDMVRNGGVSLNWLWWAFLITGMLTVFFYAKLWRRSGALTDINFYELRYSGRPAAFLRGFRAIYLGVFFNIMIMATVTLAAIKIAGVLLGLDAHVTVVLAALITMVYSTTAGLWGVVVTDFFQFALAMIGSFAAAYYAVSQPSVGGLSGLMSNPLVQEKLPLLP